MGEKRPQQKRTSIQIISTGPFNANMHWIWDFRLNKAFYDVEHFLNSKLNVGQTKMCDRRINKQTHRQIDKSVRQTDRQISKLRVNVLPISLKNC